ncbi:hypothetical protein PRIPAC_88117 [Pristionchus pacificus]|uniref:Uncharacterized protein n=1 Tax=Pristionchus pacificus TaxID=54126 RepID=A0A2A6B8N7_PRIPA|nr:hypothetical protein PRIPAC_88117 [Pristionchus pacificus]|eukprot:PDM62250.1 hypothetical protein PRIPAC_51692 [Pristionchus pacificus]
MVSPSRVVALLAHHLGIDSDLSSASREEHKLANTFAYLLKEAALDALFFDENDDMMPLEEQDYEDIDPEWSENDLDLVNDLPPADGKRFLFSNGAATLESVRYSLHDVDLQVMAMEINRNRNYLANFDASQSWVTRFKQKSRFGSRRTTKFVSKKAHVDDARIKKEAEDFVSGIKREMATRPLNTFCNADQSGFLKELHSKRSLAPIGQKTVIRTVQSCIFTPSTPSNELVILLDSRTSFRDKAAIDSSLPPGMTLHTRQIPAGTTGICQPLDVFFFRPFKGLVRRIQTHAFKNYPTFIAFKRDNILKLISIAFRIIRSPQFKPMIQRNALSEACGANGQSLERAQQLAEPTRTRPAGELALANAGTVLACTFLKGPSTDVGPCGIALCPFPSTTCADGYNKRVNADSSSFFCGTADVPQVACSVTTAAPTTTIPKPHCPQKGVWSEWAATEPCPSSSCGAFSVPVPRTRFCTSRCGDCPCVGASSDFGPCDITPCSAPGQECASGYRNCLNRDTHKLFCGKEHVPPVECNATASTSVFLLPPGAYCSTSMTSILTSKSKSDSILKDICTRAR